MNFTQKKYRKFMWISNREIKVSKIFAFTESKAAFLKSITDVDYKNLELLYDHYYAGKNEGLHTVLAY